MILFLCVIFFPFTRSQNTGYPCGKPNNIPSSERVVGGYEVGYYKYPWFAALTADDEVGCGGTLISPRTVLTAAHCFKPYFKNIIEGQTKVEDVYTIKLGMYNRCKNESTQRSFRATKVELHENYYEEMPYFDIALITLDGDTKGYTPVCLPEAVMQSETRGKEGTIQGFGRLTYENDTSPCILQEAHLLIHPDSRCRLMLNSTENNGSALQHAFCAGYLEGKVDSCMGDSGGPFLIQNKNGQYVQLGITSFGFGCAQKDVLGVYTDVSHFTDWIYEKLNTNNKTSNATSVGVSVQSSTTTNSISSIHSAIGGINITINDDIKFLKELLHTTIQPIVFALHHPKRRRKRPWRKRRPLRYYYYNRRLNSSNHYKHSSQKHA